jgi:hypothetical protein
LFCSQREKKGEGRRREWRRVRKEEEGELGFGAKRIKRGGMWEWWCGGG